MPHIHRGLRSLFLQLADALLVGLAQVVATHGLLFNESCVDQTLSSTSAVNKNPPTGIQLILDLPYILDGLAEKMLQLIGHAIEKDWAIRRGGPGAVVVLNIDSNVESCGIFPWFKLKLVRLDSSLHG